ncbi:helix-turn-helix transcriptional regulator [Levilactobacillus tujiorum]|uniref:helix-turn-helix transcriptional regulator n=1 Tax=Levilactobacillus tujiorum TaxID=2912243 RepID=UPI001456D6E9|nr:helix-turn-helix transcriptional regulator [Levilactobacillus tujiorum]NLR31921.1 helix-turn-helix transcriptional regulator [Levilactobacillus tujiorum]
MRNSIAVRRKQLKLSQAAIAELADVTRQTINAIENDKYDPSLTLAFKLAEILNTTVDTLFMYQSKGEG